jgi:hypothetical protein
MAPLSVRGWISKRKKRFEERNKTPDGHICIIFFDQSLDHLNVSLCLFPLHHFPPFFSLSLLPLI